jgi:UDP-N-acetylglucosamine--N-acetylmuramyl-(pentapeptide) pyrophosphoryl-undecaprenol N-acetylglucosamine transferase
MGKASLLIPSPIVAGNHQFHNANVLGKAGAAVVIEQKNVKSEEIIKLIEDFYNNPSKISEMSAHASELAIKDTSERIWQAISSILR